MSSRRTCVSSVEEIDDLARDMRRVVDEIVRVAEDRRHIPGGDSRLVRRGARLRRRLSSPVTRH